MAQGNNPAGWSEQRIHLHVACSKRNETAISMPRLFASVLPWELFAHDRALERGIGGPFYVGEPRARQRRDVESAIPERGSRETARSEHGGEGPPCIRTMRATKCDCFERRPEYGTRSATDQKLGSEQGSRCKTYMFRCKPFWSMTCGILHYTF